MATKASRSRRGPHIRRRIYLVLCDHSIAGVQGSQRAAIDLAKDRHEHATKPIKHFIVGPYLLDDAASIVEVG